MAFLAYSQNLNMGGSEEGAPAGPSAGKGLMLVFVGRLAPLLVAVQQALRAFW